MDTDAKVEEAIEEARWDYSAYQYATMVAPMFLADDVTGVGVGNDVLIPVVYVGATMDFLYDNQENIANGIAYMTDEMAMIVARVNAQIVNLAKKDRPGMGTTYKLLAPSDGYYWNVRTNKKVFLKKDEIWKIGETTMGNNRYPQGRYERDSLRRVNVYSGTKTQILIREKQLLLEYFLKYGQLPPGNKRFH